MRRNGRMTWKVRPTPARRAACGLRPTMSRPSSRISPVSGRRKPLSRLNSVVLPAPFGPMMPRISFRRSSKLTSWTAFRPPKERDRLRTSRMTSPLADRFCGVDGADSVGIAAQARRARSADGDRARALAQQVAHPPEQPFGREQDDADDRDAEDRRPGCPGSGRRASAFRISASGIRIAAPITGPQTVPTPPNIATISACAETSMPNTDCGVTTSSTTA